MTTQNKNIPDLRFVEFDGNWTETKLEKVIIEYKAKSTTENQYTVLTSSNKGLMKQTDYYGENRITDKGNKGFNIIPNGYITYRSRSDNRKFTFNTNNLGITGIISIYYPVFTIKAGSNKFFIEYLNSIYHFIGKHSVGTSQTVLSLNELRNIKLKYPSQPEQQKIAAFLTAVDEKVQQLVRKKDLLEQYKKGVMQKIFNQEICFKDDNGNDFADWEDLKLGDVTKQFSQRNKNLIDAKVYSVTNTKGFVLQTEHFNKEVAGSDLSNYKIIKKDDFAYNPARINVGSIAHFKGDIGVISSLYVCFRTTEKLDDIFLLNFLELEHTKFQISNYGEGGVRIYLWYDLFALIKIKLPSLPEQNKIAAFLSAIDDKINLVNQQLEKTKEYKKGLLQQMFV